MSFRQPAKGFTLIELLVVIGVIGIIMAILIPAVQYSREMSRRTQCQSQIRQIALACHQYHGSFQALPMQGGGTADPKGIRITPESDSNHHRLAYTVAILPFLEQAGLWESIYQEDRDGNGLEFPSMGPVPWFNILESSQMTLGRPFRPYIPWQTAPSIFRCPSDPSPPGDSGACNYAACMGDAVAELGCAYGRPQYGFQGDTNPQRYDDSTKRGLFANWHAFRFGDCSDGLSTTLLFSEIVVHDGSREFRGTVAAGVPDIVDRPYGCTGIEVDGFVDERVQIEKRGSRWADAAPTFTGFNTVLAPNSVSCSQRTKPPIYTNWFGGIFSSSSRHAGGVHCAFADGAVKFISDQVNCRTTGTSSSTVTQYNPRNPPGSESVFGIWGSMGTRAAHETLTAE